MTGQWPQRKQVRGQDRYCQAPACDRLIPIGDFAYKPEHSPGWICGACAWDRVMRDYPKYPHLELVTGTEPTP